jgi:hypothetical protein
MMSDTPRSDAAWDAREAQDFPPSEFVVPLAFARRVELALNAAQADAARYRWLRAGGNDDITVCTGFDGLDHGMSGVFYTFADFLEGEELDAAIDAAISSSSPASPAPQR